MLTLYDHPHSSNAQKVRLLLAELGLEYERVHVPHAHPRPDWYLAFQAFGTIPCLRDGDLVIGESNTILRYLAAREGRDDLYPRDLAERARVDVALDAWSTQVRPAFWRLEEVALYATGDAETGGGSAADADPSAVARVLPGLEAALDRFERFVTGGDTLLERFTIADCAVAPVLFRSRRLPITLEERWPRVARLRGRLEGRPAFAGIVPSA